MKRNLHFFGLFLLAFASLTSVQAQDRTIFVPPIPGNPVASGNALLAAVAAITDAAFDNQYVIKVGPGKFDLGTQSLQMKPYVDIEGSGKFDTTRIVARGRALFDGGTVIGANNCELRDLMVVSLGSLQYDAAVAIYLNSVNTKITSVTAEAKNALAGSDGILILAGSPALTDVDSIATGAPFATGIALENGTSATLDRVSATVSGASNTNRAILIQGQLLESRPILRRVQVNATGGQRAYGINFRSSTQDSVLEVFESSISASGGSIENVGLFLETSLTKASQTQISALGTSSRAIRAFGANPFLLDRSTVSGATAAIEAASGRVAVSSLEGSLPLGLQCVGVYDANYVPVICP
jgi:hypothetical protein